MAYLSRPCQHITKVSLSLIASIRRITKDLFMGKGEKGILVFLAAKKKKIFKYAVIYGIIRAKDDMY